MLSPRPLMVFHNFGSRHRYSHDRLLSVGPCLFSSLQVRAQIRPAQKSSILSKCKVISVNMQFNSTSETHATAHIFSPNSDRKVTSRWSPTFRFFRHVNFWQFFRSYNEFMCKISLYINPVTFFSIYALMRKLEISRKKNFAIRRLQRPD